MATPIQNQGKIYYSNGQIGYIAKPYDFFTKGMLNGYYFSDSSEKSIDDWIINAANDPDRYKQVVKIELIYNETYPVTHFAEQVFTNMDTNYYLSRVSTYMPNLKEIKVGEGFGNFERGKCFMGLGYVEKIDLPSTFVSVGGIENGDHFMVDMANLETLILRNPTPPEFYSASGARITPEDSFKRLGHAVVYVPDAAVETYKSNPVFAYLDIRPLSEYQESDAKTVFLGKAKGKFELNGNKLGRFYLNGVEYNTPDIIGVKKNYIEFADPEVKRLCVENWGSNGEITTDQAASVTNLGTVFSGNTAITSFDELQYFTGLQEINDFAFHNCTSLISIKLPDSVTSIGQHAFDWCTSLSSITLSNSLISIGYAAFLNCTSLQSINIPDGVTSISDYAFSNCSSLTSIDIPTGVTSISNYAFMNCSSLTSIDIPTGVTTINMGVFQNCSSLTSIDIPTGVTTIGQNAFNGCSSLTSITIPAGVTAIGRSAFNGCSSLTSITIPAGVTAIGQSVFSGCSSLTSITIPSGVTSISNYAFSNCSSLTNITSLALTAPTITSSTFRDVSSGGTLYVPSGATGYDAWMSKRSYYLGKYKWTLQKKYIEFKDPEVERICIENFSSDGIGVTYEDAASVTDLGGVFSGNTAITSFNELQYFTGLQEISSHAFWCCSSLTSVTIPNGVTTIGGNAFSECSSLTSVTIPNGVTTIGGYAFDSCSMLMSIDIPNSVTSIGNNAFSVCKKLTSVTIPTGVTIISSYAFNGCSSLTSIAIPTGVTTIYNYAFRGCLSLKTITSYAVSAPTIRNSTFQNLPTGGTLYVPANATGYDAWMKTDNYYLGKYNWTLSTI